MTGTDEPGALAILDSEWTSWEGAWARNWSGPGEFREVVEIGMILVTDDPELRETGCFRVLVKPILNPDLSDYFINLTGIQQSEVNAQGVTLADALRGMTEFLGPQPVRIYSHGRDGYYLSENCVRIGTPFTFAASRFVNVNETIAAFLGRTKVSYASSDLPELLGFTPPGDAHTAVADCRCIAQALRALRAAGRF